MLLIRSGGKLHAVAATCPHYSMPLVEGVLTGTTLRCSYHQSAFDVTDGRRLDPPALDCLAKYPVREENGRIIVQAPAGAHDEPFPEARES